MNKNVLIGIVVVIVLAGLGFYFVSQSQQPQQTSAPEDAMTEDTTQPTATNITLSEQNASGESGTATLTEEGGKVKVTLNLTGAPEGVTQPAHIHVGACPDVGEVKYPLTSPVNGVSETMLDVSLDQLRSELPLGINVHKSTDEANVYISCGDIAL